MSVFADATKKLDDIEARLARVEQLLSSHLSRSADPPRTAYRASEVAGMLGCSSQTVRNMIADGRLTAEDMGGWYAIPAESIDQLMGRPGQS